MSSADPSQDAMADFEGWLVDALDHTERDELVVTLVALVNRLVERANEAELRLQLERAEHRGRRTERLNPAQLSLMKELLGDEQAGNDDNLEAIEAQVAASEEAAEEQSKRGSQGRKRPRRQPLPAHLPRQEHRHTLAPEERICDCGLEMPHIGDDVSESLDIIPARFVVHRHIVAKFACSRCKDKVVTAPRPPRPVPGAIADAGLLAHIACAKYLDHIPLQRLRSRFLREGVDIPTSTLSDQIGAVAKLIKPLVKRIEDRVKAAHVVQTDASGLKVLDRDDPDGIRKGTVWSYVGDRKWVLFKYAATGKGDDGPWPQLEGRIGYIQADADNTFDRLFNGKVADAIEVGCWAHARRKLFKLRDSDYRVAWPLQLIALMYRIERKATRDGLSHEQRRQVRQRDTRQVLDRLYRWYVQMAAREPPTSALGTACRYAINHREALERFLDDGRLRPDNNFCELQLRSLAIGRKNYLFAGSDAGAERAAAIYSLLRTAAVHGLDPQEYLTDVLTRLAVPATAASRDALLPDAWRAARDHDDNAEVA